MLLGNWKYCGKDEINGNWALGAISHLDFIQYCSLLITSPSEVCASALSA